jgi:riboflavin synthase
MFTGIIEERGQILDVEQLDDAVRLTVAGSVVLSDVRHGDSIAVNGVCLTVVDLAPGHFTANVMAETLRRSSLSSAATGSPVNLERAARLDSRIGGHLVQGHIDGTATVTAIEPSGNWTVMRFALPDGLARYVVEKGSIAVDGVSLTVVSVDDASFEVSLIPTTLVETTLGERRVGDLVNIEVDAIAKYVERLIQWRQP